MAPARASPKIQAVAWVDIVYPSCMMSRAVAPLIELAAAQSVETRFAAFACGGHGSEKVEFERKGFAAVFEDPICQSLEPGFSESPRIAAPAGAGEGPAPRLVSFGRVSAPDLPDRLLAWLRGAASHVKVAGSIDRTDDVDEWHAQGGLRVALYLDARPEGDKAAAAAAEAAVAARARGLRRGCSDPRGGLLWVRGLRRARRPVCADAPRLRARRRRGPSSTGRAARGRQRRGHRGERAGADAIGARRAVGRRRRRRRRRSRL